MKKILLLSLILVAPPLASAAPFLDQIRSLSMRYCAGIHRLPVKSSSESSGLPIVLMSYLKDFSAMQTVSALKTRLERINQLLTAQKPADLSMSRIDFIFLKLILQTDFDSPDSITALQRIPMTTSDGPSRLSLSAIDVLRKAQKTWMHYEPVLRSLETRHLLTEEYGQPTLVYNPYGEPATKIWSKVFAIAKKHVGNDTPLHDAIAQDLDKKDAEVLKKYLNSFMKDQMPVTTHLSFAYQQLAVYDHNHSAGYTDELLVPLLFKSLEGIRTDQLNFSEKDMPPRARAMSYLAHDIIQLGFINEVHTELVAASLPHLFEEGLGPALVAAMELYVHNQIESLEHVENGNAGEFIRIAQQMTAPSFEVFLLSYVEANLRQAREHDGLFADIPAGFSKPMNVINGFLEQAAEALEVAQGIQFDRSALTSHYDFHQLADLIREAQITSVRDQSNRKKVYNKIWRAFTEPMGLKVTDSFLYPPQRN